MTLYVCISKSQPRPHMSVKKHTIEPHMMNFLWAVSLVLFLCLQLFMFSGRQMVAAAKGWRNFIGKIYQAEKTIYGIFFLLIEKRWPSFCLVGETKDSRGLRLRPRNEACMWKTKPQVHLRVIPTLQHALYAVGTPKKDARSSYQQGQRRTSKLWKGCPYIMAQWQLSLIPTILKRLPKCPSIVRKELQSWEMESTSCKDRPSESPFSQMPTWLCGSQTWFLSCWLSYSGLLVAV